MLLSWQKTYILDTLKVYGFEAVGPPYPQSGEGYFYVHVRELQATTKLVN
jgi:hypothetical protein